MKRRVVRTGSKAGDEEEEEDSPSRSELFLVEAAFLESVSRFRAAAFRPAIGRNGGIEIRTRLAGQEFSGRR